MSRTLFGCPYRRESRDSDRHNHKRTGNAFGVVTVTRTNVRPRDHRRFWLTEQRGGRRKTRRFAEWSCERAPISFHINSFGGRRTRYSNVVSPSRAYSEYQFRPINAFDTSADVSKCSRIRTTHAAVTRARRCNSIDIIRHGRHRPENANRISSPGTLDSRSFLRSIRRVFDEIREIVYRAIFTFDTFVSIIVITGAMTH